VTKDGRIEETRRSLRGAKKVSNPQDSLQLLAAGTFFFVDRTAAKCAAGGAQTAGDFCILRSKMPIDYANVKRWEIADFAPPSYSFLLHRIEGSSTCAFDWQLLF
jgi:hypothetical protein